MANEKNQDLNLMARVAEAESEAILKSFDLVQYRIEVGYKVDEIRDLVLAIREDIAEIEGRGEVTHTAVKSFWKHITELEEKIGELK